MATVVSRGRGEVGSPSLLPLSQGSPFSSRSAALGSYFCFGRSWTWSEEGKGVVEREREGVKERVEEAALWGSCKRESAAREGERERHDPALLRSPLALADCVPRLLRFTC